MRIVGTKNQESMNKETRECPVQRMSEHFYSILWSWVWHPFPLSFRSPSLHPQRPAGESLPLTLSAWPPPGGITGSVTTPPPSPLPGHSEGWPLSRDLGWAEEENSPLYHGLPWWGAPNSAKCLPHYSKKQPSKALPQPTGFPPNQELRNNSTGWGVQALPGVSRKPPHTSSSLPRNRPPPLPPGGKALMGSQAPSPRDALLSQTVPHSTRLWPCPVSWCDSPNGLPSWWRHSWGPSCILSFYLKWESKFPSIIFNTTNC